MLDGFLKFGVSQRGMDGLTNVVDGAVDSGWKCLPKLGQGQCLPDW